MFLQVRVFSLPLGLHLGEAEIPQEAYWSDDLQWQAPQIPVRVLPQAQVVSQAQVLVSQSQVLVSQVLVRVVSQV